jgi:hypothetical protein
MIRRTGLTIAALALGVSCRTQETDTSDASDSAVADAFDDRAYEAGDAPDATASLCPAMIAGCVASLRALEADCAADGLTCMTESNGSDQINECYANGVRVYWDFIDPGVQRATVFTPDGRTCYVVDHATDADNLISDTVKDLTGRRVITKSYKLTWDHTLFVCSTGQADLPDIDSSCGGPINVLPFSDCQPGICKRP